MALLLCEGQQTDWGCHRGLQDYNNNNNNNNNKRQFVRRRNMSVDITRAPIGICIYVITSTFLRFFWLVHDLFRTATRPCSTARRPLTTSTRQPTRSLLDHLNPTRCLYSTTSINSTYSLLDLYSTCTRSLLDLCEVFQWPSVDLRRTKVSIKVMEVAQFRL